MAKRPSDVKVAIMETAHGFKVTPPVAEVWLEHGEARIRWINHTEHEVEIELPGGLHATPTNLVINTDEAASSILRAAPVDEPYLVFVGNITRASGNCDPRIRCR